MLRVVLFRFKKKCIKLNKLPSWHLDCNFKKICDRLICTTPALRSLKQDCDFEGCLSKETNKPKKTPQLPNTKLYILGKKLVDYKNICIYKKE